MVIDWGVEALMSRMIGIIAGQTIYSSTKPTVVLENPQAEGEARFLLTQKNPKKSTLYWRKTDHPLWMYVPLAYNGTKQQIYTGTPGESMTIECYSQAPDELPSGIVELTTTFYDAPLTANPTVNIIPTEIAGRASFEIINNDIGNVRVYYQELAGSWNSGSYLSPGAKMTVNFNGTPGDATVITVYVVGTSQVSKPSETIIVWSEYRKLVTVAPVLSTLASSQHGTATVRIANKDASSGTYYYRIGDSTEYTKGELLGISGYHDLVVSGTPGSTSQVHVYFEVENKYNSSEVSANITFASLTITNPSITFSGSTVGQRTAIYKNNDNSAGTMYYKISTGTYISKTVSSGGSVSAVYSGTPLASFTVSCYFISSSKGLTSDTITATNIYYGDLT